MFTVEQYRARAIEYSQLLKIANDPNEVHEYQRLQRSFTELADNAQWAADNHDKTVHPGAMLAMATMGAEPCAPNSAFTLPTIRTIAVSKR